MAKVRIPPGKTFPEMAAELASIGVTVDSHQLPDGSYRAYVRADKKEKFFAALNLQGA